VQDVGLVAATGLAQGSDVVNVDAEGSGHGWGKTHRARDYSHAGGSFIRILGVQILYSQKAPDSAPCHRYHPETPLAAVAFPTSLAATHFKRGEP
jgi:hypothetical protein